MSIRLIRGQSYIHKHELEEIVQLLKQDAFDSLFINKRKPVTSRLFYMFEDGRRVCLHKMMPGSVRPHPHKYSVRVLVLEGSYEHHICYPYGKCLNHIYSEFVTEGSSYKLDTPEIHHGLEIDNFVYSIMINDVFFKTPHPSCISTANNNLLPLAAHAKETMKQYFIDKIESIL